MPIPRRKVPIDLKKGTPTPLTIENLRDQLKNLGLTCEHTDPEKLRKYKDEVERQFYDGTDQSFGIMKPSKSKDGSLYYKSIFKDWSEPFIGLEVASAPDWNPSGNALGYSTKLSTIIFPKNFDHLKQNMPSFTGQSSGEKTKTDRKETVEAIKQMFIDVAIQASAALVNGLDKTTLNSVLANAIAPLSEGNAKDYNETDSRVIFLVDNFDPNKNEASGIGVLAIDWHLIITDYKEKKKNPIHDVTLVISTRAVTYDDIDILERDYKFVTSQNGYLLGVNGIPPRNKKVFIFPSLPPANQDTFDQGLPLIAKDNFVDVIILYAPDLESVGSVDNSVSDVTTSYSKSVTSGFTFSMSQGITAGAEFEVGAVFAKGKFSISITLTFTETWNTSQTETISFAVPGRKKAFLYQGFLLTRKLRYNPKNQTFSYIENEGRFLSNVLKTSDEPITGLSQDDITII
jgi:hypothetical protein